MNKKFKLGIDAKRAFYNFTGLGNYSRDLIQGLLRYEADNIGLELYLHKLPEAKENLPFPFKDFQTLNNKIMTPSKWYHQLFRNYWRYQGIVTEKSIKDLDIFHGPSHDLPKLKGKTRGVVTIHDLIFMKYPEFFPYLDGRIYRHKFLRSCQNADLILAVSEQTKNDLVYYFKVPDEKIIVHYQTCNPEFYENEKLNEEDNNSVLKKYGLCQKDYILCVGSLIERKNALGLVKAWHEIWKEKNSSLPKLVLLGRGKEYLQSIQKYLRENNLESVVSILLNAEMNELPSLYRNAIFSCYPSYYEGFGIPIIESLFQKTPVLTTNAAPFNEAAGPGAYYTPSNKHGDLVEGLKDLLASSSLRRKLSNEGYKFVQKFHLKDVTKKLVQNYQNLL